MKKCILKYFFDIHTIFPLIKDKRKLTNQSDGCACLTYYDPEIY